MPNRRPRIDSASEAVRIMAGIINRVIKPPPHVCLEACDYPFFDSIIAEFARADRPPTTGRPIRVNLSLPRGAPLGRTPPVAQEPSERDPHHIEGVGDLAGARRASA